jgi:hypothetical protein
LEEQGIQPQTLVFRQTYAVHSLRPHPIIRCSGRPSSGGMPHSEK